MQNINEWKLMILFNMVSTPTLLPSVSLSSLLRSNQRGRLGNVTAPQGVLASYLVYNWPSKRHYSTFNPLLMQFAIFIYFCQFLYLPMFQFPSQKTLILLRDKPTCLTNYHFPLEINYKKRNLTLQNTCLFIPLLQQVSHLYISPVIEAFYCLLI
jgi:hypothetical protein